LIINVTAIANDLRLRRLFRSSFDELFDCFSCFEIIFDVLVARSNFAKNSFVINVGSFNNGI
jgi:hypothetical protein